MNNKNTLIIIKEHLITQPFKQHIIWNKHFPSLLLSFLCVLSFWYTLAPIHANATDPQKAPLILSPIEGQIHKPGWAAFFKVRVPKPNTATSFYLEVERMPLSQSKPYEKYYQELTKSNGAKKEILGVQLVHQDEGYYRARAQIRYENKPMSEWSAWRHYSFSKDVSPTFLLQPAHSSYGRDVPVAIGFSNTLKKGDTIRFKWAWRYTNPDNGTATVPMPPKRFLSGSRYSGDQPITPGKKNTYSTSIPSVDFLKAKNAHTSNSGEGEYKLFATLIRDSKEMNTVESQKWFHFSSPESIKTHFQILSPVANKNYASTIPIKLSLPNVVEKGDKIRFKWSWQYTNPATGTSTFPLTPRTFLYKGEYAGDHSVKPGQSEFTGDIPVSDFILSKEAYTDNPGIGEYKLFASFIRAGKELKRAENKGWFTLASLKKNVVQQFAINAPRADEIYSVGQYLPIHIALPETLGFDSRMRVKLWCDTSSNWAAPEVLWEKVFDNLESYKGQVFDYDVYMNEASSAFNIFDSGKHPSASCKVSANLLSSGIPMVTSKPFSLTHDTNTQQNAYTLLSPDSNRTYTGEIPVQFQFPEVDEPSPDNQWSIKMRWKIQPEKKRITIPGENFPAELNLATQTFSRVSVDNWDGMPGMSRAWTGGVDTTKKLSFSMPVWNLLEKAGVSGGKVTLEVSFLDRDQTLYSAKRSFQVQVTDQAPKQGGFHFVSPASEDVFVHSIPVELELSKLADASKDKLFFVVTISGKQSSENYDTSKSDEYSTSKFLEHGREFPIAKNFKNGKFHFDMPVSWFSTLKRDSTDAAQYQLEATLVHDGKPAQSVKTIHRFECSQSSVGEILIKPQPATLNLNTTQLFSSLKTTQPTELIQKLEKPSLNSGHKSSGLQQDLRMSQTEKSHISGVISQKSINPQPEPPGMQMRNTNMAFQVMPFAHTFQAPATVAIKLKNAAHSRPPFQLRHGSVTGKTYTTVIKSNHSYSKTGDLDVLTLKLKNPGHYQIRFRTDRKGQWGAWEKFDIYGNTGLIAKTSKVSHIQPSGMRLINPQPEPPGKQLRGKSQPGIHSRINSRMSVSPNSSANQIRKSVHATIIDPKNKQKYRLGSKHITIEARMKNSSGRKLVIDVQQKKNGRFVTVRPTIRQKQSRDLCTASILIRNAGEYRLRVKPDISKSSWSKWRMYSVERPMRKHPKRLVPSSTQHIKPSSTRMPKRSKPTPTQRLEPSSSRMSTQPMQTIPELR